MIKENKTVKKTSSNKITKPNKIVTVKKTPTNKMNKTNNVAKKQKINTDKIEIKPNLEIDSVLNYSESDNEVSSINTSDIECYSDSGNQENFDELDNLDLGLDDDSNYQELNDSDIFEKDEPDPNIQTNTQTNTQTHNIDLGDVFKIFEKIFSAQAQSYFQNDYTDDSIIHIRKNL